MNRYSELIQKASDILNSQGYIVMAALAPKTSTDQPGLLYRGHDYSAIGRAADKVLPVTYEWGYTYGPPMAVAPIPQVRKVLEYGLTQIPSDKILMGIPNYGYDPLSQSPFFRYSDIDGIGHEVWFEDERSLREKFSLVEEYNLSGVSFWNVMIYHYETDLLLNSQFEIRKL